MEDSAIKTDAVKVEDVVEAEVIKITDFGAFVKFGSGKKGLIHISQVSDSYVKKVDDHLKIGDKVKAKIMKVSPDGKIDLTLK
ncbi:MAG TPA: S1 RNA-binding domain-containing protein, partial [Candidatus Omnitrophota bacterium]|nr:S1 RNA-binding domain-containing protein [Candidatus Omnitrophota bacterium]